MQQQQILGMKSGYLSFLIFECTLLGGKCSKLLHVKNVNLLFPPSSHKPKASQGSPQWLLGFFFSSFSFLLTCLLVTMTTVLI